MQNFVLYMPNVLIGEDVSQTIVEEWPQAHVRICATPARLAEELALAAAPAVVLLMIDEDALSRRYKNICAQLVRHRVVLLTTAENLALTGHTQWGYVEMPFASETLVAAIKAAVVSQPLLA